MCTSLFIKTLWTWCWLPSVHGPGLAGCMIKLILCLKITNLLLGVLQTHKHTRIIRLFAHSALKMGEGQVQSSLAINAFCKIYLKITPS